MKTTHDHYASREDAKQQAREALLPSPAAAESPLWDRTIMLLRYGLPVLAGVFGLTTMLYPVVMGEEVSFTLSRDDVNRSGDQLLMENMHYTGTDRRNRMFEVRAAAGRQDSPTAPTIVLDQIAASMEVEPGNNAKVTADNGIYETGAARLLIGGNVNLTTDNGYSLTLSDVEVLLREKLAESRGGVTGKTPLGNISAERMSLDIEQSIGTFDGKVRIRIVPDRIGKATAPSPAITDNITENES